MSGVSRATTKGDVISGFMTIGCAPLKAQTEQQTVTLLLKGRGSDLGNSCTVSSSINHNNHVNQLGQITGTSLDQLLKEV